MGRLDQLAKYRNLVVLSGTVLLVLTGMMAWYYLLPLHLRDLGAGDAQVGLAFTLITASYSVMQFVGGLLADRFGRKAVIVVPTFLVVPLYLGAAFSSRWYEVTAFLVVIETLGAIQWPAFVALIAESVPEEKTGSAFGLFEFAAGLGFVAGPALGSWLVRYVSPGRLIAISAAVALLCAPVRALLLQEPKPVRERRFTSSWKGLITPALLPVLLGAVFLVCMNNLTLWGPFLTLHAEDIWHWSRAYINRVMAIGSVASTLASLTAGRIADRYGASNMMILGAVVHTSSLLLLTYLGPSRGFWGLLFLSFIAAQLCWISYNAFVSRLAPTAYRGGMVGLLGSISGVVGAVAPGMGGLARMRYGSQAPFWLALAFALGAGLAISLRGRERKVIHTIGHSTRSLGEFIAILKGLGVEAVADVRRFPRSRHNPQFNEESLGAALAAEGIEYHWLGGDLGGYRSGGYEVYTKSEGFREGLRKLEGLARRRKTAVMCAEKLWFRCHRRFIADELVRRGWEVWHFIEPDRKPYRHKLRETGDEVANPV